MCLDNNAEQICGRQYADLLKVGSRFNYGPQCRTAIQDHIIKKRLTPIVWRKDLDGVFTDMFLTQNGQHLVDLMRSKVERCIQDRIQGMVAGGLIETQTTGGHVIYSWRADADNFLGAPGWCKDWSVEHGQMLQAKGSHGRPRTVTVSRGKASDQGGKSEGLARKNLHKPKSTKTPTREVIGLARQQQAKTKKVKVNRVKNHVTTRGRGHIVTNAGGDAIVIVPGGTGNNCDGYRRRRNNSSDNSIGSDSDNSSGVPDSSDDDSDDLGGVKALEYKREEVTEKDQIEVAARDKDTASCFDSGLSTCLSPADSPVSMPPLTPSVIESVCSIQPSESASRLPKSDSDNVGLFKKPHGVNMEHLLDELSNRTIGELLHGFDEAAELAVEMAVLSKRIQLSRRHRDLVVAVLQRRDQHCWLAGIIRRVIADKAGIKLDEDPLWWFLMLV